MLVIRAHFPMSIHDVYFSGEMTSMTLGWGVGDPLSDDPGGLLGGSVWKKFKHNRNIYYSLLNCIS